MLVPNLFYKMKYVIHIAALDQVLRQMLILKGIRWAIKFDQVAWLVLYISFNIQLRMKAKNDCKKDFFKFMSNSVFGKTMENIRKHKDINLMMNQEAYLNRAMKPNFKSGI